MARLKKTKGKLQSVLRYFNEKYSNTCALFVQRRFSTVSGRCKTLQRFSIDANAVLNNIAKFVERNIRNYLELSIGARTGIEGRKMWAFLAFHAPCRIKMESAFEMNGIRRVYISTDGIVETAEIFIVIIFTPSLTNKRFISSLLVLTVAPRSRCLCNSSSLQEESDWHSHAVRFTKVFRINWRFVGQRIKSHNLLQIFRFIKLEIAIR